MRNIFDQYQGHENRLTHALVTCLDRDRRLLGQFLQKWVKTLPLRGKKQVRIIEQRWPDGVEAPEKVDEEEDEKKGIPDACIYVPDEWALLIESKAAGTVSMQQLARHRETARRRMGLKDDDIHMLAIAVKIKTGRTRYSGTPPTHFLEWRSLYSWLTEPNIRHSLWARGLVEYMEVAERRMIDEKKPLEGAMTQFSGIHFGDDQPYDYKEAKRLLNLAMAGLRENKNLLQEMKIDRSPDGGRKMGRKKITGKQGSAVWDLVYLKGFRKGKHTSFPHLTLAIRRDDVVVVEIGRAHV